MNRVFTALLSLAGPVRTEPSRREAPTRAADAPGEAALMGIRLQRQLASREALTPGQFFTDVLNHAPGQLCLVYVCCPGCGGVDTLSPDHVVERGGRVVPAWKCPTATCPIHEWLELDSYGEPVG